MERLNFAGKYSFKNIITPKKLEWNKQLVHSIEKVLRRMRYRAYYYLQLGEEHCENNDISIDEITEPGRFKDLFKSGAKPPIIKEMQSFETE